MRTMFWVMSHREASNRLLLRARDHMARSFRDPPDVPALARIACCSQAHFSRSFTEIVGESPTRYRQRGDVEAVPNCFVKAWVRPSSFGEAS